MSRFQKIARGALATALIWSSLLLTAQADSNVKAPISLGELLSQNSKYLHSHGAEYYADFKDAQNPGVTLLSCSDSRAHSTSFFNDPINRVFAVRNIGNQIHNNFGSVDYGVHHLYTPLLLVMGHTHCGAVQAAMQNYASESFAIVREVDHLAIPLRGILQEASQPHDAELLWARAVEHNVDYQVEMARRRYADAIAAGKLNVVGAVSDISNAYGAGYGQLVIVNLNGEKDLTRLRLHRLVADVPEALRQQAIRRLKP
ncbi:MAG: carbonic anhydrase [Candidatus Sericytochromatia bacterium]|nr:carbonic anhydrase [Candidatus Sericytochromatia bacterium]